MKEPQIYEINIYGNKHILSKGENDEIDVITYIGDNRIVVLRTYLWYFNVKEFYELKAIDKEKVKSIIERQLDEKYFFPMPYDEVKRYVIQFLENIIGTIDQTISDVKEKIPGFTSSIKDIAEIDCMLNRECQIALEYDEEDRLSSYYSLIGTEQGHLSVPLFLDYVGAKDTMPSDEKEISLIKNILYFIRGYDKTIPESARKFDWTEEDIRSAISPLFQKAIVLYNKLWKSKDKPHYTDDNESYYYDDDEYECPEGTLPDGMGYCRKFDYEQLMQKSEKELMNEITESLLKIKEKVFMLLEDVKGGKIS